jgi:hypothetical protein
MGMKFSIHLPLCVVSLMAAPGYRPMIMGSRQFYFSCLHESSLSSDYGPDQRVSGNLLKHLYIRSGLSDTEL